MGKFRSSSVSRSEVYGGQHRFEHWYRDNTVYLVTSRTQDGTHVFRSPEAQVIFWSALEDTSKQFGLNLWVSTLMSNHYHLVFYLRFGENLGKFVQRLHGSVAKQVNDLSPARLRPFWCWKGRQTYFDGCLRDETQLRRTWAYVRDQSVKAGLVRLWAEYPNTRVTCDVETAVRFAHEREAFLPEVPYPRYDRNRGKGRRPPPRG